MIILKCGDAKKLESAKRWKCKCSECGCKVILDKEDIRNYKNDMEILYLCRELGRYDCIEEEQRDEH